MADYYPVLARAVSRLAVNNAQTRQELYEHARTVLVAELERNNPERSTQAALRERIEFETTVLRVEATSQLGYEKSPETLLHRLHVVRKQHGIKEPTPETVSDFASLLRQPARKSGKPAPQPELSMTEYRFWHQSFDEIRVPHGPETERERPLLGVKRTSGGHTAMSAFDPKRTLNSRRRHGAPATRGIGAKA